MKKIDDGLTNMQRYRRRKLMRDLVPYQVYVHPDDQAKIKLLAEALNKRRLK